MNTRNLREKVRFWLYFLFDPTEHYPVKRYFTRYIAPFLMLLVSFFCILSVAWKPVVVLFFRLSLACLLPLSVSILLVFLATRLVRFVIYRKKVRSYKPYSKVIRVIKR